MQYDKTFLYPKNLDLHHFFDKFNRGMVALKHRTHLETLWDMVAHL